MNPQIDCGGLFGGLVLGVCLRALGLFKGYSKACACEYNNDTVFQVQTASQKGWLNLQSYVSTGYGYNKSIQDTQTEQVYKVGQNNIEKQEQTKQGYGSLSASNQENPLSKKSYDGWDNEDWGSTDEWNKNNDDWGNGDSWGNNSFKRSSRATKKGD